MGYCLHLFSSAKLNSEAEIEAQICEEYFNGALDYEFGNFLKNFFAIVYRSLLKWGEAFESSLGVRGRLVLRPLVQISTIYSLAVWECVSNSISLFLLLENRFSISVITTVKVLSYFRWSFSVQWNEILALACGKLEKPSLSPILSSANKDT